MGDYIPSGKIKLSTPVTLTSHQFDQLNNDGLNELFISHPIVIKKTLSKYTIYLRNFIANNWYGYKRFDDTIWHANRNAKMVYIDVNNYHPLTKTIEKYFSHLIMR